MRQRFPGGGREAPFEVGLGAEGGEARELAGTLRPGLDAGPAVDDGEE